MAKRGPQYECGNDKERAPWHTREHQHGSNARGRHQAWTHRDTPSPLIPRIWGEGRPRASRDTPLTKGLQLMTPPSPLREQGYALLIAQGITFLTVAPARAGIRPGQTQDVRAVDGRPRASRDTPFRVFGISVTFELPPRKQGYRALKAGRSMREPNTAAQAVGLFK